MNNLFNIVGLIFDIVGVTGLYFTKVKSLDQIHPTFYSKPPLSLNVLSGTPEKVQMAKIHYFDPISDVVGLFNGVRFFARKIKDDYQDNEVRLIIMRNRSNDLPDFIRIRSEER